MYTVSHLFTFLGLRKEIFCVFRDDIVGRKHEIPNPAAYDLVHTHSRSGSQMMLQHILDGHEFRHTCALLHWWRLFIAYIRHHPKGNPINC